MNQKAVRERNTHVVAAATLTASMAVLPAFLVGATGVLLRDEFGLNEFELGRAVACLFLVSAASSVLGGRLVQRVGSKRGMVLANCGSGVSMLGIGVLAGSPNTLVAFLALGGIANSLAHPATNMALADGPLEGQGLLFGIKQAAVPIATLVAGATVPTVAWTVGWRWAFIGSALLLLPVAVLVSFLPKVTASSAHGRSSSDDAPRGVLVAVAAAAGLGVASATALGTFLVEYLVAIGFELGLAGAIQVGCSILGISARLAVGWVVDSRSWNPLTVLVTMLLSGSLAYVALGLSSSFLILCLAAGLSYALGWGWAGLLWYVVVGLGRGAPAKATGIVQIGPGLGAALGPVLFGLVVNGRSYSMAWSLAAIAAAVSGVALSLVWVKSRRLRTL